ncbi:MAG: D-alanyl-D-alanine carboxypeptidase, partial [Bacteroidales bacterium]|nr:D-alanyl-D-alanine carboxypeptidase [Bacteroidales bacterium]
KSGNNIYLVSNEFSPSATFGGTLAIDRRLTTVGVCNKFPAQTIAADFAEYLRGKGIQSAYPARDIENSFKVQSPYSVEAPENLTEIVTTLSPSLQVIIKETLNNSNNLFADTIIRYLGRKFGDNDSFEESVLSEERILDNFLGIDFSKIQVMDGSGLSRRNFISPRFFCHYLAQMSRTDVFEAFLEALPSQGYGTLADMPFLSNHYIVKAKSGSLNGVRCYVGYLIPNNPKEDSLCFAIMANNFTCPQSRVRTVIYNFLNKF